MSSYFNIPSNVKIAHLNISLCVNDNDYRWHDPQVNMTLEVSVPVEMFDKAKFAALVQGKIDEAVKAWPAAVEHAEKEKAEEAEREAKREVERLAEEAAKAEVAPDEADPVSK